MHKLASRTADIPVPVLVVLSMLMITLADAAGKEATQSHAIWQVLWIRGCIWIVFALSFFPTVGELKVAFGTQHRSRHILRSLVLLAEIGVMMLSFSLLPLGDVTAIIAAAPIIVTALSVLLLGETLTRTGLLCLFAGFAGVLLVAKPGVGVFGFLSLIPLFGVVLWGTYQVFQKRLGAVDDERTSLLWTAVILFVGSSVMAPWFWTVPTLTSLVVMGLAGLFNVLGHFGLIVALKRADASAIQPFTYASVVWALGIGFVAFGEVPDLLSGVGIAAIVLAGLRHSRS